ncbi:MAG TPA: 50S ribosomal protein L22 [Pyrinomonadaceae bacterium]|nr:50S ribosomal protein L22 [Pyrinomonadaceae bacterium]
MDARASAKYLRGSAQKARLVVDMIRGKNVNEALAVLQYTNKRAADGIEKCLRSAVANATEAAEKANIAVDPDDLWVKACFIDMGPTKNRRRMRPAPQGRAYKERRHFHHVTVLLSSDEQEAVKGKRPSKAGKPQTTKPGKKLAAKTSAAPKAAAKRAATKKPETAATETPAAAETTATTTSGDQQATAE